MPYLMVKTNQPVPSTPKGEFLALASQTVAEALGKPERLVMVALEDESSMVFGGDHAPCVYMELKSIGLPQERTAELSESLCTLIEKTLGIVRERIFIEFADAERHMWGYNGGTFAK
ncbi:phenylpyruvate tautomerase MIF-related protein [Thiohalomonas denitrificans]|uniref:L-dopachrome isomerase n=1 Tax=Thiohalomonas denitrificans TaxID=415747 RepID=A0A1G5QM59_9GAMM|nr:phenylpyruvate tautomerase MIF-related protein [Thiohalomonas denitrificans]SCZ62913.1 Macrophage migration inhibitory factor (MIF) [Thiohalomonas denitrificans]